MLREGDVVVTAAAPTDPDDTCRFSTDSSLAQTSSTGSVPPHLQTQERGFQGWEGFGFASAGLDKVGTYLGTTFQPLSDACVSTPGVPPLLPVGTVHVSTYSSYRSGKPAECVGLPVVLPVVPLSTAKLKKAPVGTWWVLSGPEPGSIRGVCGVNWNGTK